MSNQVEILAKTLIQVLQQVQAQTIPTNEWSIAHKPMEVEIDNEKKEDVGKYVIVPSNNITKKKELRGFPTGTFLDDLFLNENNEPLGGIPACSQIAITGLPDSGKSILIEEIAIRVAHSERRVLYITGEDIWSSPTSRFNLQSRLMQKANILGLNWEKIAKNLFVLDIISTPELQDWKEFATTYRYVCETHKIELVLIDSITVLETYRGALKYRVLELCRYNQRNGITAIYVNQRGSEKSGSYEMAGGIGLPHNFDGTIIVDYCTVYYNEELKRQLGVKRGEFVRFVRVLGCRLCGFIRDYIRIDITKDGFLRKAF